MRHYRRNRRGCFGSPGDWKIAKCYEYALIGLPAPYDITELNAKRQAVRDEINELEEKLKKFDIPVVRKEAEQMRG